MRAARYHEYGDESVLTAEDDVPEPTPGEDEVLVRVEAASVNPIDTYAREGNVKLAGGLPHVGGSDMAGVVKSVGDNVTEFVTGDRVFATGLGVFSPGTYAQYTVAPTDMLAPLSESVSFRTGAGAAMAFATAWRALVSRGELSLGDTCLVHGASGGVGHAAVQVAVAAGSDVVGTAREGDPTSLVRSLGADGVIDYRSENLADELAAVMDDRPLDVVLEPHADLNLGVDLTRLAQGGKIVVIGEDSPITLDGGTSMTAKQADADLRFMSIVASPDDQAPILRRVGERLADGTFTVEIDRVFGLDELSEAHAYVQSPGTLGKVVIDTQS